MESAWDRLLDLVDRLATDVSLPVGADTEDAFVPLIAGAMEVHDIDSELHVPDVARWLVGLVHAHRAVRATHPDVHPDDDLSGLRVIITRWLHRVRPR
ncbi:hypothetical protein [Aeromicrobium chenweiae]|uniref:Uncharacterized protein n=1 Tax=Aeromicrobium chenweiae TaxID=2079793 RepID=A0A2S0WIV7_9ACTN|nr:hypothetical protein [Aeromicrobium chenweiae]AWB91222.1 hypothetical protein C3E78_02730 [Aeromicrobium chenweiae]TGN31740.1 hypothetical protein E4L97_12230 [Aeromicrobium chenweiae]